MKDAAGVEIKVGDRVAFIPQGGYTQSLEIGFVESLTAQKVKIRIEVKKKDLPSTCLKYPKQIAVVVNASKTFEE